MTFAFIYLLPVIPMLAMIISDFITRRICVMWLAFFVLCIWTLAVLVNGWEECSWNMLGNAALLAYLAVGIFVYLRIKTRRWVNPINKYIGSGDLWLFIGFTPLFDLKIYLLITLSSFLISLVWWIIMVIFNKKQLTIPLAGIVGIVFCFWSICNAINL